MIRVACFLFCATIWASASNAADFDEATQQLAPLKFQEVIDEAIRLAAQRNSVKLQWVEPGLELLDPRNDYEFSELNRTIAYIADTIPLQGDIFLPSLDRLSQLYERALYDPLSLNIRGTNNEIQEALLVPYQAVLIGNFEDFSQLLRFVPNWTALWTQFVTTTKQSIVSKLEEDSDASIDDLLSEVSEDMEAFSLENWKETSSIQAIEEVSNDGNFQLLRELKVKFEAAQNFVGDIQIVANPGITSWFTVNNWRKMSVGSNVVFFKQVDLRREWFNIDIIRLAKQNHRASRHLGLFGEVSEDYLFRRNVLLIPKSLLLAARELPETGRLPSVRLVAVYVEEAAF